MKKTIPVVIFMLLWATSVHAETQSFQPRPLKPTFDPFKIDYGRKTFFTGQVIVLGGGEGETWLDKNGYVSQKRIKRIFTRNGIGDDIAILLALKPEEGKMFGKPLNYGRRYEKVYTITVLFKTKAGWEVREKTTYLLLVPEQGIIIAGDPVFPLTE